MTTGITTGIRCNAKINLFLAVTGRRQDGFHDILTFFQPVSLFDELKLELTGGQIELVGDTPEIPWDERNLCFKAASEFISATGCDEGVRITVSKNIPHGAGLGGGSSDAAGVLTGMNHLHGKPIGAKVLEEIALRIGSDVPFFVRGTPAAGRGRGEILEKAEGLPYGAILIVKPDIPISTKTAYDNVRILLTRDSHEDRLNHLLKQVKDFPDMTFETFNSFESYAVEQYPEIKEILEVFRREEPTLSLLSGSGSACFALFDSEDKAVEVERLFMGQGYFTSIAKPVDWTLELFQWN
ncbi:MAG: 4-(cytidine 5'-diphospho)-2-C-methyl-D-erythritol kinase [Bacteroidales bacterium]|nr:4-(cytidine 5'-diphospho)-2-C-methyl-D-erythritol kinase [Candidatus Latescibacterota bacterium]